MRDFVREMVETWTQEGDQAAYDLGPQLLAEIAQARDYLTRQESAIRALGLELQSRPSVNVPEEHPVEPEEGFSLIAPSERRQSIIEAAEEVWEQQQTDYPRPNSDLVTSDDVFVHLKTEGLALGVQQPFSVIATVLARAEGFARIARNTFRYTPPQEGGVDPDDIPL